MSKSLLLNPRFSAYFSTQFLGAFNDNVFKNGLTLSIIFTLQADTNSNSIILINIAAALFILPFILFSPIAGQLAQNSEKSRYIQNIKCIEILIMCSAAVCFLTQSINGLLLVLFLMGTQSTFFGPAKYSILPLMLDKHDLYQANALVETGTFIAILLGLFLSAFIIELPNASAYLSITIVFLAGLGYWSAKKIPIIQEQNINKPNTLSFNIIKQLKAQWIDVKQHPNLLTVMLGISWFWFIGASYLTQLPAYVKTNIHAESTVYSLLLILFSVGIGIGSLMSRFATHHLTYKNISLLGLMGLILFGIIFSAIPVWKSSELLTLSAFLNSNNAVILMLSITFIGFSGGCYIVPLYTLLQLISNDQNRSTMVANNNVLNALFMIGSALLAIIITRLNFSLSSLFFSTSVLSLVVLWRLNQNLMPLHLDS